VVYLQSPCYIFGDIHGNLEDLHFFSDNIWRLGMSLTAGNFLFLGDYVDRGLSCLEVLAYLMAMKLQLPQKVFLLRGNHETRDVNGWEEHYGERSFIWQCRSRFGDDIGYRIWEACNQVFDRLPLACVVDQDIFCVHGGIPRPISRNSTRIQDILNVPRVAGINPPYEHEDDAYQQVASDCIWSDPASEEQEMQSVDPETGFGESLRGGGAICFGNKAVTDFLQQQGFSYIMRAHEAHAEGVAVSKQARVFTVFSTSKDHNQGSQALAGCILVDDEKMQVINRSPAYKNQYVHRRGSVSLQSMSNIEIAKRMKLGLITTDDQESDEEEWDEMESEEGEEVEELEINDKQQYTFAQGRRSSINLQQMTDNFHDSQVDWDPSRASMGDITGMEYNSTGDMSVGSVGAKQGSVKDLSGLIRQVVQEDEDDEASTVDGNEIEDKEMKK
jgi:diadenosine tetraphosphatase ApaH/serine/threonine PP2A family protein phosphatase